MKMPDSQTFNSDVERTFAFLADNGFSVSDRDDTALTAGVTFRAQHVAVSLGLDRRDACVDCYLTRVVGNDLVKNNAPGGYWGHFYDFLIKYRGYRGALKEFKIEDPALEWYQLDLLKFAGAIKSLAPDIIQDSPSIFNNT
jgi:hypothetical protein